MHEMQNTFLGVPIRISDGRNALFLVTC